MANIRILENCIVSGVHASAGEVLEVSQDDAAILIGCSRGETVKAEEDLQEEKPKPKSRTKAQIAADLAAAKEAEAKLQADLSKATE